MKYGFGLSLLTVALLASPVFAQDKPLQVKGVTNGPCMEGICEYQLKNGLKVLLFPDSSKPVTTVNIAYGVGSVHEGYGETGMAHLLEHLLFKDSAKFTDIPNAMKERSITYNATTSFDRTNYFSIFPTSDERLKWVLDLEADRMKTSKILKKDLDSEMTVVRNEMERGENSNPRILQQRLFSTAFLWHPYRRSTIGARSDVENVQIPNLRDFYHKWYRPDNATLVVAGQFDAAKTLDLINRNFGALSVPAAPLQPSYTVEPTQDGERSVLLQRQGDVQIAMLGYHTPAAAHSDLPALNVLATILNDVPSGRLYKALVEPKIAAGASLNVMDMKDPALTIAGLSVDKAGDLNKAQAILIDQLQGIAKKPITQEELDLALQKLRVARERMTENVNGIGTALTESIAQGDWRMMFYSIDQALNVKLADVNAVAAKYFKTSNRTVARFEPTDNADRVVVTAAPTAAEAVKNYKGSQGMAAGEDFDPTPQNVAKRTEIYQIAPGLTVSLMPKKTRGNTVMVNAQFRFGDALQMGKRHNDGLVGSMMMLGSKQYDRKALRDKLVALKANGSASGGPTSAAVSINAKRDTVNEAIAVLSEVLREPTVPDTEFDVIRSQVVTSMESGRNEPATRASAALSKHFNTYPVGHPMAYRTLDEQIADLKSVTPQAMRDFHRDYYGTNDGTIAVVGDFDVPSMKAALAKAFSDWKAPQAYKPIPTKYEAIAPETVRIQIPDKANVVVMARTNLSLNDQDPEYFPMMIAESILGSGMDSRLSKRLRQVEGLTYGVGANIRADSSEVGRDDQGWLSITGTMAPANVDKFVASMKDELNKFVKDGVTEAEVKKVVGPMLEARRTNLASETGVASILNTNARKKYDMAYYAKRTEQLSKVTAADVNAALKKLVRPENLSVYIAGDLDAAAKK